MDMDKEDLLKEIALLKNENTRLKSMVGKDPLTGLVIFQSILAEEIFTTFFERCLRLSKEEDGSGCWLVFVDLLNFKLINDTLGHKVGDEVLKTVGDALKNTLRAYDLKASLDIKDAKDTFTRAGGDEFILGLEKVKKDNLNIVFSRIINSYSKLIRKKDIGKGSGLCLDLGFNFGAASVESLGDSENITDWVEKADSYMYKAKQFSHNQDNCISSYVIDDSEPNIIS